MKAESSGAFARLRQFVRKPEAAERCELCHAKIDAEHRHVVEVATCRIVCACDPCGWRFPSNVAGRFKLIPRDARRMEDFQIDDAHWEQLSIPIGLAFFFYHTPQHRIRAFYPSPGGVAESSFPLQGWEHLPGLTQIEPDVEALLVHRIGTRRDYFLAPLDRCFELVGLIRMSWRGLSGGEQVWEQIDRFFFQLNESVGGQGIGPAQSIRSLNDTSPIGLRPRLSIEKEQDHA